jgi:hypothetical protein
MMNYFTPQRYVALQDFSSDAAMNAADATWEAAADRYRAYYRDIEGKLPPGFKKMQDAYYLHDAIIPEMGQQDGAFLMVLRLDTPPHDLLFFQYELAGVPVVTKDVLPAEHCGQGPIEWMYDEVELTSDNPLVCTHSILLSNGWEVRIPFRDVRVQQAEPWFPFGSDRHVDASGRSCSTSSID